MNQWTEAITKILNTAYYEEKEKDKDRDQEMFAQPGDEKAGPGRALTAVLSEEDILKMLTEIRKLFLEQPACLEIGLPVKICGDTHGQFSDLIRLFHHGGFPPNANYLFLGDYVDRGKQNLETVLLLFYYKLRFPNNMFLLRGNHETEKVNRVYGFYEEIIRRYKSEKMYEHFQDVFNVMPLAAIVGDRILCMHGGISPHMKQLSALAEIERPNEIENDTLEMDLLWADPVVGQKGFEANERGASYGFGEDILTQFLKENDLDMIARAHQVVQDGYEFFGKRRCVTLFSAPHYIGQFDNAAAIMTVNEHLVCTFDILRPLEVDARPTTKTIHINDQIPEKKKEPAPSPSPAAKKSDRDAKNRTDKSKAGKGGASGRTEAKAANKSKEK